MQVLGLSLKITAIALLETGHCITSPTTLRLSCYEANHVEELYGRELRNLAVLARVLQRNRTNRLYKYREIYYKGLAHMTREAQKSHDLPSVSWRPRKADGFVLVHAQRLEN